LIEKKHQFKMLSHIKPTSIQFFIVLMVALIVCLFLEHALKFTRDIELYLQDRLMRWRNQHHSPASEDIALIRVDESTLLRYDGGPPPRGVEAKLVKELHKSGARTIAFDFTFDMKRKETEALAEVSKDKNNLVYGVAVDETILARDNLPPPLPQLTPFLFRELNDGRQKNYALERIPCQTLRPSIKHLGHIMLQPSVDGTVRHVPLLIKSGNGYYPALSLIAVCLFKDVPLDSKGITVKWGKYILLDNQKGWQRKIPIDQVGRMRINYIGDAGPFKKSYSFWNLERDLEMELRLDSWPHLFADKLVLIGNEASRADWMPTPFSRAFPGAMVHATVIDNMLAGEFVAESSPWLASCLTLCFSGMMFFAQLWLFRPRRLRYDSFRVFISFLIFAGVALIYASLALSLFYFWGRFLFLLPSLMSLLLAWIAIISFCYVEQLRGEYVYRQTIIQNMGNGLLVIDRSAHQVEMNPKAAMLLGFKSGETTLDAIEAQSFELAKGLRGGLENTSSDEFQAESGGRTLQVSLVPFDKGGENRGSSSHLIAVLTDVTEVQRLSAELQRQRDEQKQDQMLKNLVAKLNHDIKNDLNGIIGLATLLTPPVLHRLPKEDIPENASRIITASRQITEVVNHVSQAIRTGNFDKLAPAPALSPKNLSSLVEGVVEEIRPRVHLANVKIDWKPPENLPMLNCHEVSLREAIRNLFINALEAMPNGGQITIRIENTTTSIRLRVRDTGHGISPDIQDRIFEQFFTGKTGGTGLGLAQVKGAVERIHRGRITVESEVGHGTEFTLILPQNGNEELAREEADNE